MIVSNSSEVLITRTELATKLNLHPNTINNLEKRGIIEAFRIGGSVRYQLSEVMDCIKKNNQRQRLK